MKKMMIALMAVLITVALAGIGTYAYFSDTATITDTTFTVDTMDLMIDSNLSPAVYDWSDGFNSPIATIGGLYPGYPMLAEHAWIVIDIKNVGNVAGNTTIQINRTSGWNALPANLIFTVYYDSNNDGLYEIAGPTGTLADFQGGTFPLGGFTGVTNDLGSRHGKMASIRIEWSVPGSAGNEIQGLSTTVAVTIGLNQVHA